MKKTSPLLALLLSAGLFSVQARADWQSKDAHCVYFDPDSSDFEPRLIKQLEAFAKPETKKIELPEKIDEGTIANLARVCRLSFWKAVAAEAVAPPEPTREPQSQIKEGRDYFNALADLPAQVKLIREYAKDYKSAQLALAQGRAKVEEYKALADKLEKGEIKGEAAAAAIPRLISAVGKPRLENKVQWRDKKDKYAMDGTLFHSQEDDSLSGTLGKMRSAERIRGQLGKYMAKHGQWVELELRPKHDHLRTALNAMDPKMAEELTKIVLDANKQLNRVNGQIAKSVYSAANSKDAAALSAGLNESQYLEIAGSQPIDKLGKKTALEYFAEMLNKAAAPPADKPAGLDEAKKEFSDKLDQALEQRIFDWNKAQGKIKNISSIAEWKAKDPADYKATKWQFKQYFEASQNGSELLYKYKPSNKSHTFDLEKAAKLPGARRQSAYDKEIKKIGDMIFGKSADNPEVKRAAVGASIDLALKDIKEEGLKKELKSMLEKGGPGSILGLPFEKYSRIQYQQEVENKLREEARAADRAVKRAAWAEMQREEIRKIEAEREAALKDAEKAASLPADQWEAYKEEVEAKHKQAVEATKAKYAKMSRAQTAATQAGELEYRKRFEEALGGDEIRTDKDLYAATIVTEPGTWWDTKKTIPAQPEDINQFFEERYLVKNGDAKLPAPKTPFHPIYDNLAEWKQANVNNLYERLKGTPYDQYSDVLKAEIAKGFQVWYKNLAQKRFDSRKTAD